MDSFISMPGGHPSTTAPIAGPWDSPQVVTQNILPNVLPDMVIFIFLYFRIEGYGFSRESLEPEEIL
jgi:hypothetical protein